MCSIVFFHPANWGYHRQGSCQAGWGASVAPVSIHSNVSFRDFLIKPSLWLPILDAPLLLRAGNLITLWLHSSRLYEFTMSMFSSETFSCHHRTHLTRLLHIHQVAAQSNDDVTLWKWLIVSFFRTAFASLLAPLEAGTGKVISNDISLNFIYLNILFTLRSLAKTIGLLEKLV